MILTAVDLNHVNSMPTAEHAALCLYAILRNQIDGIVHIYQPIESMDDGYGANWRIDWASGPEYWALELSNFLYNDGWNVTSNSNYDLMFEDM